MPKGQYYCIHFLQLCLSYTCKSNSIFYLFTFCDRKFCTALVYVAIFMLVFFWATPVAFISSLITLENIAKKVPFLDPGKLSYIIYLQLTLALQKPQYNRHPNNTDSS